MEKSLYPLPFWLREEVAMRIDGKWQVPIEWLSASSLSDFLSCPERWRLRRLKHIPESTGPDKWAGLRDHDTHAFNFGQKIQSGNDLPVEDMHNFYDTEWDKEVELSGEPDWYDSNPEQIRETGHQMLETYHALVSPTVKPIAVEARFEEKLKGVPVPLVGYVDIEESGKIIERKTTKARTSKPKPNWLLQGRLYSMIYAKKVEWHVVTRAKLPTLCLPETDPELKLEIGNGDSVLLLIQQAAYLINDMYLRYGSDKPWPASGLGHPFLCQMCFAGPKFTSRCIAWSGDAYTNGDQ